MRKGFYKLHNWKEASFQNVYEKTHNTNYQENNPMWTIYEQKIIIEKIQMAEKH